MSRQHVNRILCAGQPDPPEAMERLLAVAEDEGVQATALIGELAGSSDDFRVLFRRLARASHPVFWIPGPGDAPADRYLRESYNVEVAFPLLRGGHGTAEAEYRLKVLGLLDYNELVMLFASASASAPAHKGRHVPGSEGVAELVGTYRPRLVVCRGERGTELLGKSLVVAPGLLSEGHYAVADPHARTAEPGELSVAAQ
jgi:uncharacterized protein